MIKRITLLILLIAFTTSCIGLKKITYLQPNKDEKLIVENGYIKTTFKEKRLEIDDIIEITVNTIDTRLPLENFNRFNQDKVNTNIDGLVGKRIDNNGYIDVPTLGAFKASGLTINELREEIYTKLVQKFPTAKKDIYVKVEYSGVRFSTLGEVRKPGKYQTRKNRLDIFEAIAISGDLNGVADRKQVILLRAFPEGEKMLTVDLTDRNIINSPYYYLKTNDRIIVNPLPQKIYGFTGNGIQTFATILSVTSSAILFYINYLNTN